MYKRNTYCRPWRFLLSIALMFFIITTCFAQDVTLHWDANTESDLAGYNLYYKLDSSGAPYNGTGAYEGDSHVNIPLNILGDVNNPEFTLTELDDTSIYFMVVTAYDGMGNESGYSNEVFTFYISLLQNGFIVNAANYQAFSVSGHGAVGINVDVYVNDILVGTTTPIGTGSWLLDVDFTNITEGEVVIYATTNISSIILTSGTYTGTFDITAPTPPTITQSLVVNVISNNQVDLMWDSVPNATGYIIYRNNAEIGDTIDTNYNDVGLSPSTTYEYEVATQNNPSSRSNLESVTTLDNNNTPPPSNNNNGGGCFINVLTGGNNK